MSPRKWRNIMDMIVTHIYIEIISVIRINQSADRQALEKHGVAIDWQNTAGKFVEKKRIT